jgi:hypothetical protein
MARQFFSGTGPGEERFGPESAVSRVMAALMMVTEVLDQYREHGTPKGLYTFAPWGPVKAGLNPVGQFMGSFRWTITRASDGITLTIKNATSFKSLTNDQGPQWLRRDWLTPMGNTHQTYAIQATCGN